MDYYEELGLSRSATDIDINKACVPVSSPSPSGAAARRPFDSRECQIDTWSSPSVSWGPTGTASSP